MSTQAAHFIIVFLIAIIHLCSDLYRNVLYCSEHKYCTLLYGTGVQNWL